MDCLELTGFTVSFKTFPQILQCNLYKRQSCHHRETRQLICRADQLSGFYMLATLARFLFETYALEELEFVVGKVLVNLKVKRIFIIVTCFFYNIRRT